MLKMEVECKISFREWFYPFPVHNIGLTSRTSAPFERTGNFGVETIHGHFEFIFYLLAISGAEEHGNTYRPVCIYACCSEK
jgi:hypothetical protein